MKILAFEMKVGNLMEYQGKLWRVIKLGHVKPGKGGAFVQAEMKELSVGTKLNERFRSDEKLEKAHVESRKMQYLYAEGDSHIFMDLSSYEQLGMNQEDISEQLGFLLPNMEVDVNFYNENPIGMELPLNVVLEVVDTESVVKGQTATSSGKPAKLETGISVTVPQFINIGEKIKVNTGTGEYVERANS
jgi:elongation factor P